MQLTVNECKLLHTKKTVRAIHEYFCSNSNNKNALKKLQHLTKTFGQIFEIW